MPGEHHHIKYTPEPPSVGMTFVRWSALGSLLLLVLAIGGLFGIYQAVVPARTPPAPQAFPLPRVDTTESDQLRRLTDAQNRKLETWQWVDQQHSTVEVPIDRAMQLLAKKGADAYAPLLSPPQAALSPPTAAAERTAIEQDKTPPAEPEGATPSMQEPHQ
jgi:hypothetical protein